MTALMLSVTFDITPLRAFTTAMRLFDFAKYKDTARQYEAPR